MSEQSKRLADELDLMQVKVSSLGYNAAAELRRLQAENEALRKDAGRALEAWDITGLPVSGDGMLQERMECLRAALAARPGEKG